MCDETIVIPAHRVRELLYFIRFGLVGASGIIIDMTLLALLLMFGLSHPWSAALAIWGAMTWNYVWNRRWTFGTLRSASLWSQYLQFCLCCLLGGLINWGLRVALTTWVAPFVDRPFAAALFGVLAGFGSNYLLCRWFVFRQPREHLQPSNLRVATNDNAMLSPNQPSDTPAMVTPIAHAPRGEFRSLQRLVGCG